MTALTLAQRFFQGNKKAQAKKKRNRILIALFAPVFLITMYGLAFGTVVLNGTTSLPDNAYFMLRWPKIIFEGSYVAFESPAAVDERFRAFDFIKRVAGVPGDEVITSGNRVCVNQRCRTLQESLVTRGVEPTLSMVLEHNQFMVFADSEDSLDSRYAVIGPVRFDKIEAVGFPIPFPHWKEIQAWFR